MIFDWRSHRYRGGSGWWSRVIRVLVGVTAADSPRVLDALTFDTSARAALTFDASARAGLTFDTSARAALTFEGEE